MSETAVSFTVSAADQLPGEAQCFFDTREARRVKLGPDGCGFAYSDFPPLWCPKPVEYVAVMRDDYDGLEFGEVEVCAEHAARLRALTGWQRVARMWSS